MKNRGLQIVAVGYFILGLWYLWNSASAKPSDWFLAAITSAILSNLKSYEGEVR